MAREAWRAAVPGVAKSQTQLSDWPELNDTVWLQWLQEPSPGDQGLLTAELDLMHNKAIPVTGESISWIFSSMKALLKPNAYKFRLNETAIKI